MNDCQVETFRAIASLLTMVREMNRKHLDLKRITKTASLLMLSGVSQNSIPQDVEERCLSEQASDGGWISVVDTMWNVFFLRTMDSARYDDRIKAGLSFLRRNANKDGLWGRSKRDRSRVTVSGTMLFLLPDLGEDRLIGFEDLWVSEMASLTYKAAYSLLAFRHCSYSPRRKNLIPETAHWLVANQRTDGSFAPWLDHPVSSDIYCTSVAALGQLAYPEFASRKALLKALTWIRDAQLPSGIWPFHEIEDGASWALLAIVRTQRFLETEVFIECPPSLSGS